MSFNHFYIGGRWVPPHGTERLDVENPATEEVIATIPLGDAIDVAEAVGAAGQSAPSWASTTARHRASLLRATASALESRHDLVAQCITGELGSPIRLSRRIQASLPVTVLNYYADLVENYRFETVVANSTVLLEPVGVVGAITPWNYPLYQIMCKVAPALAAGATVVLKPSELTPLVTWHLFEAFEEAGIPAGVVNFVTGLGPETGEVLVRSDGIDLVSFTGSTRAGRRVSRIAADTVKPVSLELGGKSASVILPDADLPTAVKVTVANAFLNAGQTCSAWTRMLVHDSQYGLALELAVRAAERSQLGDPTSEATTVGPLVSAAQRERVVKYIETGVAEGARVVSGGTERPEEFRRGHYVRPTVLADVEPDSTVAQEEIFGPVLAVLRYGDEDEALSIANNSQFGLAGAVWSGDQDRAIAFARRMKTGSVDINGGAYNPAAPFGGVRQSGHGRELGLQGLEEYLQTKSLQL